MSRRSDQGIFLHLPQMHIEEDSLTTYGSVQLEEIRNNEDPRLSFATPEFKEAQRTFTERFKVCQKTCTGQGLSPLLASPVVLTITSQEATYHSSPY